MLIAMYFNYVFQILVFQLLDNSANKHAEQSTFFSCFTSGSCSLAIGVVSEGRVWGA